MKKAYLNTLPDVLNAKDIAGVLGVGYVKALKLIQFGNMPYIKAGNTYHVAKKNFIEWVNSGETKIVDLD